MGTSGLPDMYTQSPRAAGLRVYILGMNFVDRKLLNSILAYGTFKINYGWSWFILNTRMQLISFYELCAMQSPFEVRCKHGT